MHERIELRLPDLGFTAAGLDDIPIKLCIWYAAIGDRVTEGESLVEILAGEVALELTAPASGFLAERGAEAGAPLAVGQLLAIIESGAMPRGTLRPGLPSR
jgi:pyruvate/2-oxoglutarate dehydrogenase complex dihydrolipoamide acyltransferase (E2) component